MDSPNPFADYSTLLWAILLVGVPAFAIWQLVRLKRALHVFQLEGYKRGRFLAWCRANRSRARFLSPATHKKPLVMTGRARRIVGVVVVISVVVVLLPAGAAHLIGGAPWDVAAWLVASVVTFLGVPWLLVAADVLLDPVQRTINGRYLRSAAQTLERIDPLVVAVTGSFGKTSTKFAIEATIGPPGSALATPGSYNTPLGVCRTINENLEPAHRYLVVEMGAYREGEIAELCRFVHPRIGVLTAIGPAHLDRFGSLDAIRRAKYEIVQSLPADGAAVMNVDDPEVRALADATDRVGVVRYGLDAAGRPDLSARDVRVTASGTSFEIVDNRDARSIEVSTRLLGRYAVGHVLAATAVAVTVGRPLNDVAEAIARLQPVEHRLQLIQGAGGITVIDDAFNSNPDGAAAALEVLEAMPARRKVVVTPGIIELGPLQAAANEHFGEQAAAVADAVIVVARVNRDAILAGARRAGTAAEVITVDSLEEATAKLPSLLGAGDVVLFENDLPDQYEN
ncbi:MAG: UDP-N-acetylmuramoyl-tripeptide--D-alanyl-D-alanine ligase [Actinomycetota bacterium]|nr:UDP-N-acetylmuramoyl-tripeptide--D-alanyl-D-alanine ligase [Actinomycetota bacterium]